MDDVADPAETPQATVKRLRSAFKRAHESGSEECGLLPANARSFWESSTCWGWARRR